MDWFPLYINLQKRACLVIGGGHLAERKSDWLLRAGANLTVIAPSLSPILQQRYAAGAFKYKQGLFSAYTHLLQDCDLVIAATDSDTTNAWIAELAKQHKLLVNVVDDSQLSNFIMPAIIDHSPTLITVSTSGEAPTLARLLKAKIQANLPANLGRFTQSLGRLRQQLKEKLIPANKRRMMLDELVMGYLNGKPYQGSEQTMQQTMVQVIEQDETNRTTACAQISIIGAGPGDPELLTLKAHRLLQTCDVILYDHLVSQQILSYGRRDALRVYVGKQAGAHHCSQDTINNYMLTYYQQGLHVVRLKGGDPLIFSRLAEECAFLNAHRIPYQIIPGVTAALGCAASMGIPLTHRSLVDGCIFLTAHHCSERTLDWQWLAKASKTLVFYMGLKQINQISQQLIQHGMDANMPVAVIEQGTTEKERILVGTLADLPERLDAVQLVSPVLIIVGEVVHLYQTE